MSKFKLGEIVIFCGLKNTRELNGEECEITEALDRRRLVYSHGEIQNNEMCYGVTTKTGYKIFVRPEFLRKKKPPEELSTWEEIQALTNWNPAKVLEDLT